MDKIVTYAERAKPYEAAGYKFYWNKDTFGRSYSLSVWHTASKFQATVAGWPQALMLANNNADRHNIKIDGRY